MYILMNVISLIILLIQTHLTTANPITGGTDALEAEFPFQVSLQRTTKNNRHFCGGSIIHEKFVLTAAHCVLGSDFSNIRIVAGVTDLRQSLNDENIRNVDDVFKHPSYHRPLPMENDIALIKVDKPFTFNKFINKVTIASTALQLLNCQKVYATGWGLEKASDKDPTDTLKKTKIYVLRYDKCVKKYEGLLKLEDTIFCTFHKNVLIKRGVCNGDSGSPIVINKNILVGVVKGSFHGSPIHRITPTCGSNRYPDMHSEVSKYRTWIDGIIRDKA